MRIKYLITIFSIVVCVVLNPAYSQIKNRLERKGLAKTKKGRKDAFSGRPRAKMVSFEAPSISFKQRESHGKRKKHSLSKNRSSNQRDYSQRRIAKGLKYRYNVASDSFSKKSKKKHKSYGKRGETFYKKKHKKSRFSPHRGRETRRMDKSSKKSFKK